MTSFDIPPTRRCFFWGVAAVCDVFTSTLRFERDVDDVYKAIGPGKNPKWTGALVERGTVQDGKLVTYYVDLTQPADEDE